MPIYEYKCTACNHEFDVMQKMSDNPIKVCPNCSKNTVERLISAAGFQLKGSGWYVTDFKNNNASKPAGESTKKPVESSTPSTSTKGEKD